MSILENIENNSKFIRKEIKGYRTSFILKCLDCPKEIKIRCDYPKHSGKCRSCSRLGKPFMTQYKNLFHDWRNTKVTLTYVEYLEFTKIKNCHYCNILIPWQDHRRYGSSQQAYFLDRKNNNGPYSKKNCVVCCTRCNRMRSNKFSYEEFYLIGAVLKEIEEKRKQK